MRRPKTMYLVMCLKRFRYRVVVDDEELLLGYVPIYASAEAARRA